jgi:hypothetical protein
MNSFTVFMAFALAALAVAEPPSGYSYSRPSGGHSGGSIGGGFSSGGFSSGGFSSGGLIGGGGYQSVPHGYQTSEGQHVDPQLLEQVRQILLREESQLGGGLGGHGGGGHGGGISSTYGVPSSSYGVPSYQSRVVGIDLDGVRQAIQVAQYSQQTSIGGGGYSSGYPSGPSAPSGSYGVPSRPSGSYGAPY